MSALAQAQEKRSPTVTAAATATGLLQRKCACGGVVGVTGECEACRKKRLGLQAKLAVNEPGDVYEQEADRVAARVMSMPVDHAVSTAPLHIQRVSGLSSGRTDDAPASVDRALASVGSPLDSPLREDMERRFGHDFSRVRVHSDFAGQRSAEDVNAIAYTVGDDIVFGAGRYQPASEEGRALLAHELTHVVQQGSGNASVVRTSAVLRTVQRQVSTKPITTAQHKTRLVRIERYWRSTSARAFFDDGSNEEVTLIDTSRLEPASEPEGTYEKVADLTIDRSSPIRPHVEFASHASGWKVKVVTRLSPADRISKLPANIRAELWQAFLNDPDIELDPQMMEFIADMGEGLKQTSGTTKIALEGRARETPAAMQIVDEWVGEQRSNLPESGTRYRSRFTQLLSDVRQLGVTGPVRAEDLNVEDIELVLAGAAGGQSEFQTFREFKRVMEWKLRSGEISVPEENADFYIRNEYRKAWRSEAAGLRKMSRIASAAEAAPFLALGASAAVGTGFGLLEFGGAGLSDWLLARGVTSGTAGLELGGEKVAEWFAARGLSSSLLTKWVGTSLLASSVVSQFISARDEAESAGIDPNSASGIANTASAAILRGFGIGELGESITDRSIQTNLALDRSGSERIERGFFGALGTLGAFGTVVPKAPGVVPAPAPRPIGSPTLPGTALALRLRLGEIVQGAENARVRLGVNAPTTSLLETVGADSSALKPGSTSGEIMVRSDPAISPDVPELPSAPDVETPPPAPTNQPPIAPPRNMVGPLGRAYLKARLVTGLAGQGVDLAGGNPVIGPGGGPRPVAALQQPATPVPVTPSASVVAEMPGVPAANSVVQADVPGSSPAITTPTVSADAPAAVTSPVDVNAPLTVAPPVVTNALATATLPVAANPPTVVNPSTLATPAPTGATVTPPQSDTQQLAREVEQAQQRYDRLREKASQAETDYAKSLRNTARATERKGETLTPLDADLLETKRKLQEARADAKAKLDQAKAQLRVLQPSAGAPSYGQAGLSEESRYLAEVQAQGLPAELLAPNTPVIDLALVTTPEVHSVKSIVPSEGSEVAVGLAEKGSTRDLADRISGHVTTALVDRRSDKWSRLANRWNNTMRESHADHFGYDLPKNPDEISFVVEVRVVTAHPPSQEIQQEVRAAVTAWLAKNERVPPNFTWRIDYVSPAGAGQ